MGQDKVLDALLLTSFATQTSGSVNGDAAVSSSIPLHRRWPPDSGQKSKTKCDRDGSKIHGRLDDVLTAAAIIQCHAL